MTVMAKEVTTVLLATSDGNSNTSSTTNLVLMDGLALKTALTQPVRLDNGSTTKQTDVRTAAPLAELVMALEAITVLDASTEHTWLGTTMDGLV